MNARRLMYALFATVVFVVLVQAVVVPYGAEAASALRDTLVREQNLDANNNIRVHEQGVADVTVQNTSANPVVTKNATGHKEPWSWWRSFAIPAGEGWSTHQEFSAPADKYIVIEFFTAWAKVPSPLQPIVALTILNSSGTASFTPFMTEVADPTVPLGESVPYRYFSMGQQVKFYVEPGCTARVEIAVLNNETYDGVIPITMTGYLTDEL